MLNFIRRFISDQKAGQLAENIAQNYLISKGLKPIARNWRCRYGEIDLIMLDHATLVFVEVRLRTTLKKAAESITVCKQKK